MDASDRDRKRAWKLEQRSAARRSFPMTEVLLESLFESVNLKVAEQGCDHTLRFTEAWLSTNEQPAEKVLMWLNEHGGFCDCEVLANAADHWEQNR
jgi:Protein of unknown function (DUF2695)